MWYNQFIKKLFGPEIQKSSIVTMSTCSPKFGLFTVYSYLEGNLVNYQCQLSGTTNLAVDQSLGNWLVVGDPNIWAWITYLGCFARVTYRKELVYTKIMKKQRVNDVYLSTGHIKVLGLVDMSVTQTEKKSKELVGESVIVHFIRTWCLV